MAFAAAFLVILLVVAPSAFAAQYPVDWKLGADYSSWTTKDLNAGDTLVFTYDGTHNVEQVTKSAYDNCAASNAIKTYNGGKTTITLAEGPAYFICGTPGHCDGGMKLQVTAKAAGSGSSSTPSSTPTPSGSGSTPSTSSPASSNGVTGLSSVTPLMFGLPLALGTLFAFMC